MECQPHQLNHIIPETTSVNLDVFITSANEVGRRLCIHPCLPCLFVCLLAELLDKLWTDYTNYYGEVSHDPVIITFGGDPDNISIKDYSTPNELDSRIRFWSRNMEFPTFFI